MTERRRDLLRPLDFPEVFVFEESFAASDLDGRSLDGGNGARLLDADFGDSMAVVHGDNLCYCRCECLDCMI